MIRRLVLWDVDGTLLRAGDIGAAVFDLALEEILGTVPPERIRMSGKTDPQIVAEYLAMLGRDPDADPALVEKILAGIAAHLARAATDGVLARGTACPGAAEVLEGLAGRAPEVAQTLLTGNIRPNAEVKVAAYGLADYLDFDIGAYGSDSADRNSLVPVALGRVAAKHGRRLAASEVWVVGDTPRDLACARAAGARCLLVATGRYTLSELDGLGADAARADLTDTDAVVELLAG